MGRPKRADAAGHCYHMLNRANLRATIFHKPADFEAFEKILDEALDQFEIDLFAYCLMPNHYHLLVRPRADGTMPRFGQYIGLTHTLSVTTLTTTPRARDICIRDATSPFRSSRTNTF